MKTPPELSRSFAVGCPVVVAHRGASGYLPEHTLEAYAKAIDLGADLVEPDLVATKDGTLIARHDPWLGDTTDVGLHPKFSDRKTTYMIDGKEITDWFASDFTIEEIKTLYAVQPVRDRDQSFNGRFKVPSFEEIITLVKDRNAERKRTVGIYPETKHSTYHRELGLRLEDKIVSALASEGWTDKDSPVIVQSFESSSLKYLRAHTGVRLVQLMGAKGDKPYDLTVSGDPKTYGDMSEPSGLQEIAIYAEGISVPKHSLISANKCECRSQERLIRDAHDVMLFVHAYTFRNELRFILQGFGGDPSAEYSAFYKLGVDGVFSDFPDTAISARDVLLKANPNASPANCRNNRRD